jgi:putative membrane protein
MDVAQKEQLTKAVERAESATSAEIVLVVLPRSYRGVGVTAALAAVTAIIALGVVLFLEDVEVGPALALVLVALIGAIAFALARLLPLRFTTRLTTLNAAVDEKAHAAFSRYGVYRTSGRTGMLVLLSLAEHQARLIFDLGVTEAVPAAMRDEWRARFAQLATQFDVKALVAAVTQLGDEAGAFMPRGEHDVNELANAPEESS